MACDAIAHVHRNSLDHQIYGPAASRGSASIPVSTCLGFCVLFRSYTWYVHTGTISTVSVQTAVEIEAHHCRTSRLKLPSPTEMSVQYSTHHAFFISVTAVVVRFIYAGRLDPARHTASITCLSTRSVRESVYHGKDAAMKQYR